MSFMECRNKSTKLSLLKWYCIQTSKLHTLFYPGCRMLTWWVKSVGHWESTLSWEVQKEREIMHLTLSFGIQACQVVSRLNIKGDGNANSLSELEWNCLVWVCAVCLTRVWESCCTKVMKSFQKQLHTVSPTCSVIPDSTMKPGEQWR